MEITREVLDDELAEALTKQARRELDAAKPEEALHSGAGEEEKPRFDRESLLKRIPRST